MQQLPGRLISSAIVLALLGIALAIPSLFTPSPVMRWAAYGCGGLAALLAMIEAFVWCSLNLSWKQAFMAMSVALLVPTALIWGLSRTNRTDEAPATDPDLTVSVTRPPDPEGAIELRAC